MFGRSAYMDDNIIRLKAMIEESDNIVFFGGAGVSTESGIPDFRSVDGLYNQKYKFPPEEILSRTFFERHPDEYYRFHRDKLIIGDAKPNPAHLKLAELEAKGKLKAVITQNIDGLHQAAGSKNVIELHGTLLRAYCSKCYKDHPVSLMNEGEGVPRCECGGVIRPDIVLYEEALRDEDISAAIHYIRKADMLIIGGTSLVVYPAAALVNYYRGHKLVLINRGQTSQDYYADLVIREKIGEVFSQI